MTDLCQNCKKPEPAGGWYLVGVGAPEDMEFYCSAACLDDNLNGSDDEDDPAEECGRWQNGRLARGCSLAGTEFCDWDCPYSR